MFYSYVLNKLSVFFSIQMQTNSSCFVKSYNISSLKFFALSLEKYTRGQKYFAQARLVTLVTISNCVAHGGHPDDHHIYQEGCWEAAPLS